MLKTSNDGRKLLSNFDVLAQAPEGVAKLRELILTLAVQGKLVPQDPSDEPASMLLQRIQAEKARLVAEGKIKKEKPLPEISDEEKPFELPVGWVWARLSEVGLVGSSSRVHQSDWKSVGVPFYRAREIVKLANDGHVENELFISEELFQKFSLGGLVPEENDLMITGVGTIGVPYVVKNHDRFYFKDASVLIFKNYGGLNSEYLSLFMRSPVWVDSIHLHSMGTTVDTLTIARANLTLLSLPPLAEQSRIVARVESLMQLCDALEAQGQLEASQHQQLLQALLGSLTQSADAAELAHNWQRVAAHFDLLLDRPEAIDALEQTILQLAVRGLLVPQDPADESASELLQKIRAEKDRLIAEGKIKRDKPLPAIGEEEKPFELPQRWEWVRLGNIGESFDYGSSQKSVDDSSAVPILRMGNIQGGKVIMSNLKYLIDTQEELPHLLLQDGDLLFNRTNSYELVGKTAIFTGYSRNVTFASYLIRIRLFKYLISANYVNIYMNTRDCRENEIEPDLTQQTGQANYNGTKLKNIRFPLPPLAEQSRIVARVNELRALCQQLRDQLTQARHTQSLLAQAWVAQAAV